MKRILLAVAAFMAIAVGAVWFAASESYVLNLRAEVGTALDVSPHGSIDWETVFANQSRTVNLKVKASALAEAEMDKDLTPEINDDEVWQLDGVAYRIGCNSPTNGDVDICHFMSVGVTPLFVKGQGPQTVEAKITRVDRSVNHILSFEAPACEGAHQKTIGEQEVGCTQSTSVVLSGGISIERQGFQGKVEKCTLTDKKDVNNTACP